MGETQSKKRRDADKKFSAMMAERVEWEPWWQDLRRQFAPGRGRFTAHDRASRDSKRRNSMPRRVVDEFAAGMQSGLVSPSRSWFTLSLFNNVVTIERVKVWLSQVQEIMAGRMLSTNFYDQIVEFMKEEGIFGTAAMFIEEDDEDIFICRTLTAGQYAIEVDVKGRVNHFARRLSYTALQLANDFGEEVLPRALQVELRQPDCSARYEVCHLIRPSGEYRDGVSGGALGMEFESLWWIAGLSEPDFLRESGYHEFPVVVGRWKVIGDDVYGREHPGDVALDDALTMQDIEMDSRGALERAVKPPMLAPSNLLGKLDNRPNRVTLYEPMAGAPPVITPLFGLNFDHVAAENKIEKLKVDIERAFYVDLFRMWGADLRQGRTATEVQARESEKAYILAPITLRQTNEIIDKAILRIYAIMSRAGMFPPPPDELIGQDVKLEYTSEFALLQKRAAQAGIEVVMQFAAQLAEMQAQNGKRPEVLDRIDPDEVIERIAAMHALPAGIVLGDDAVTKVREDRALEMQQQQEMQMAMQSAEMVPEMASAAKSLSQTNVKDDSALATLAAAMNGGAGM